VGGTTSDYTSAIDEYFLTAEKIGKESKNKTVSSGDIDIHELVAFKNISTLQSK